MNSKLNLPVGVAVFAALVVGLMFLMSGGLLQAQSAEQFFTYPENGDGPVATFTATDPEGAMPVFWSLTGTAVNTEVEAADVADAGDFKIDQSGVLSFMTPPNYEAPAGGGISGNSNEYRVTVQASDGVNVKYFVAYVNVTDVEETGKVIWAVDPDGAGTTVVPEGVVLRQFQPGASLTASVTDPDAETLQNSTWKWYRSGTEINNPAEDKNTYTVTDSDVGSDIRVTATYSDGSGPAESVSLTSETSVQTFRRSNDDPAFASTAVTRRIAENSTGNVGGPIPATDANNGDILTYAIADGSAGASFRIDAASGQLMVGPALMIDYENDASYMVEVTAYDSSGAVTATPAMVTINVVDEDEKPTFNDDVVTRAVVAENAADAALTIATYTAMDPEGENVTLSLVGDDEGLFELAASVLSFKESPDFEMPGDRNQDNVYEVTVRASDGTLNADLMVAVNVTNNIEENGQVTLSSEEALVGVELTATLTDLEVGISASGQITDESWTWHRGSEDFTVNNNAIPDATSSTYTPVVADADAGYVIAMVVYTYQFGATTKMGTSDAIQVLTSRDNQAPKFRDGARTFRVVAENPAPDANDPAAAVGRPVEATDANGDTLTYTLGGSDKDLFEMGSTAGQIEVKGGAVLDHETKPTLTVTLTANDGSGTSNATASITVTIYVADVDEAPVIKDRADSTAKGERTVAYAENGTRSVATFSVSDPEGASPIVWSLTEEGVGDTGVTELDTADRELFDITQDGVLTFKTPPSFENASESTDDNYQVTVQASDGNEVGYFKVTVEVTDVEETGKATWTVSTSVAQDLSLRQFQPGATLMASVTDPDAVTGGNDGAITTVTWKWYRSSTEVSGEIGASYLVSEADVGSRIRVVANYLDGNGGPAENVSFTSETPVQASRLANTLPVFDATTVTRRIAENSTGNVGGPITATDADNGDILTYSIPDVAALFAINPATGQLMVGEDTDLDFEDTNNMDHNYVVEVTVRDSSAAAAATVATVTINVLDVNEKPTFNDDVVTRAVVAENAADAALTIATYTAMDPEGENVTLSLVGDDEGLFELAAGVLSFKESPDFEMPGDRNQDNVYEVTVRASDGTLNEDRMVTVKVINATDPVEDGLVTLSSEEALVGVELTATLTDLEGGVSASGQITGESWTWFTGPMADDVTNLIVDADSSTYTPVAADADVGAGYVKAMVSYTYQFGATKKMGTSDAIQVLTSRENQAPKFRDGSNTFRVVVEGVEANTADDDSSTDVANDNIGSPVSATDANGDMVAYALSGPDASRFRVRSNGQLEVKVGGANLDHETNASHTVTLMVDDGSGESNATASITVTIYVADVDEAPIITAGGLAISGSASPEYAEGGTGSVATYTAVGSNADMATWSLGGDDAGDFNIAGGVLTFRSAPDYETPADADGDNTYLVTVMADDGSIMATQDVMVMVTNMEEMGTVTLSSMAPSVDTEITATLVDEDGGITGTTWQWSKSMTIDGTFTVIPTATSMAYTPVAADEDYYLRATASYDDGEGSGRMATATTASPVTITVANPLLDKYDTDGDGLDRGDVIEAILLYFADEEGVITRSEIIDLILLYFAS